MSSIGTVGNGLNLPEILQQAIQERQAIGKDARNPQAAGAGVQTQFENQFSQALSLLGVSNDEAASIKNDIHTAIDNLRQNGDGGKVDLNQAKDAIGQVLADHNIDSKALGEALGQSLSAADTSTYGSSGTLNPNDLLNTVLGSVNDPDNDGDNHAVLALLQSLQPRLNATA